LETTMTTFLILTDSRDQAAADALLREAQEMRLTKLFTAIWRAAGRLRGLIARRPAAHAWGAPETV